MVHAGSGRSGPFERQGGVVSRGEQRHVRDVRRCDHRGPEAPVGIRVLSPVNGIEVPRWRRAFAQGLFRQLLMRAGGSRSGRPCIKGRFRDSGPCEQ